MRSGGGDRPSATGILIMLEGERGDCGRDESFAGGEDTAVADERNELLKKESLLPYLL